MPAPNTDIFVCHICGTWLEEGKEHDHGLFCPPEAKDWYVQTGNPNSVTVFTHYYETENARPQYHNQQ